MEETILQLNDGQWVKYNPESKLYEVVNITMPPSVRVSMESTTDALSPSATSLKHPTTDSSSEVQQKYFKNWNFTSISLLIELVIKYDCNFQKSLKKVVWKKIAEELSQNEIKVTAQQCDTKWKGLVETYKNVKKHNDKSGNSRKDWIYFEAMDNALAKRPEICPVVTCSNTKGLVQGNQQEQQISESASSTSTPTSSGYQSNISFKRKLGQGDTERRHREKLARQDRFLDLFENLVTSINQK